MIFMKDISAKEVEKKVANHENLHIIDVREDEEVVQGMIPGAVHIPLNTVSERANELDKEKSYIMVCRSGGRSGKAKDILISKGFHAVNMLGGMLDWEGPIE